jgi:hypothetical protein
LLVHHAEIATTAMAASELEKLGAVNVEQLKGFLPIFGEVVGPQPCQHPIQGPLGCKLGRD